MQVLSSDLGSVKCIMFERSLEHFYKSNTRRVDIHGRMDAVTNQVIWELKYVSQLSKEHFLQAAVYAWMSNNAEADGSAVHGQRAVRLLNLATGVGPGLHEHLLW